MSEKIISEIYGLRRGPAPNVDRARTSGKMPGRFKSIYVKSIHIGQTINLLILIIQQRSAFFVTKD